jgi:hypothetical protein
VDMLGDWANSDAHREEVSIEGATTITGVDTEPRISLLTHSLRATDTNTSRPEGGASGTAQRSRHGRAGPETASRGE